VLSTGSTIPALLASAAVPGVLPSVVIDGRDLVDGGVAADAPVPQATAAGATTVYLLPRATTAPGTGRRTLLGVLVRTVHQVLAQQDIDVAGSSARVMVLPAPVSPAVSPFDFRHAARLVDDGYATASAHLRGAGAPAPLRSLAAAA
jgi:NTE family protein